MGNEAENILSLFSLNEEDKKKYDTVKEKFENVFVKKRNVIYERARFNQRKQQEGENVDFVTSLHTLADSCSYGALHDKMIRDRIVVGLSEKLQLDSDLTLEKAVKLAQQSEAVKKQ